MFAGVIHRVLVGYLGRYIKDFHKHQVKLSLWNEEVFLENVELIPDAFDFLQLPFSLKHGRIGRLSIRISWKKLVWDYSNTVFIVLQDVFLCASPRNVHEWYPEAIEKREIAGKKAKLAAAELEKLSRRVCDHRTGKWFFSFIMAKILKSIQVSIRNFHVQYCDENSIPKVLFGIRFSSLTVKQSSIRSSGKELGLQGNKIVENDVLAYVKCDIEALWVYCHTCDAEIINDSVDVNAGNCLMEETNFDHLLHPFDVFLTIRVNKVGKNLPQHSVRTEVTRLVVSLSEIQILQILNLIDYFNTGHLREKYGRYRPWDSPLSSKLKGWQKLWWQYAQQAVLSDVRKKLKKNSWRCLGNRLINRRKYINFYKRKLESLQKEQSPDELVLQELEKMEVESDVDEILTYRSAAEYEMKEVLVTTADSSDERQLSGESKSTGWLNWLSRGLLGAGGTGDFGQFAGVVSDEVVKDIYKATEFHPDAFSSSDVDGNEETLYLALELKISFISAEIWNRNSGTKIADLMLTDATIECKFWDDLKSSLYRIKLVQLMHRNKILFQVGQSHHEKSATELEMTSSGVLVNVSTNGESEVSVKVILGQVEHTCDTRFYVHVAEFFIALTHFKFFHQRVLLSLDGIENTSTRLLLKAEYIVSIAQKLSWDVTIRHAAVNLPWKSDEFILALYSGSLHFTSKHDEYGYVSYFKQPYNLRQLVDTKFLSTSLIQCDEQNLYNVINIELEDLELSMSQYGREVSIVEKFNSSMFLSYCTIEDSSILERGEVFALIPTISITISMSICEAAISLVQYLTFEASKFDALGLQSCTSSDYVLNRYSASAFGFTFAANVMEAQVCVDLGNAGDNHSDVNIVLRQLRFWYTNIKYDKCCSWIKSATIVSSSFRYENDQHILLSCGNEVTSNSTPEDCLVRCGLMDEDFEFVNGCFIFHIKIFESSNILFRRLSVKLSDAYLHCHPYIFGIMTWFFERVASSFSSIVYGNNESGVNVVKYNLPLYPNVDTFGYPNGSGVNSSTAMILSDIFKSSLGHSISDWKKLSTESTRNSEITGHLMQGFSSIIQPPGEICDVNSPLLISTSASTSTSNITGCLLTANISVQRVKLHLHDNSCIIGIVTLPRLDSSVSIYSIFMDVICTIDGLTVTSSFASSGLRDIYWLHPLSNLSPIMNIRIRKEKVGTLSSSIEVSVGVQHICCVIPSECLAVLVGYFSLPEWRSDFGLRKVCLDLDTEKEEINVTSKIEILDSALIFPVEQDDHMSIKITVPHLNCCFFSNADPDKSLQFIPPENLVARDKLGRLSDCFNVCVKSVAVSFLSCCPDDLYWSKYGQHNQKESVNFIEPFSADVWVRVPCSYEPIPYPVCEYTCIMARISECQIVIDGDDTDSGFFALRDVISQMLEIEMKSKHYCGDALQYFQKNTLKNTYQHNGGSCVVFTEVQCSVDTLSIKFYDSESVVLPSEPVFAADFRFILSASLRNELPHELDVRVSNIQLQSVRQSVILFHGVATDKSSPVLFAHYSQGADGRNELEISLPSIVIIFDLLSWSALYDAIDVYANRIREVKKEHFERGSLKSSQAEESNEYPQVLFSLHVKSGETRVQVRIPVQAVGLTNCECGDNGELEPPKLTRSLLNFVEVNAHILGVELLLVGQQVRMTSALEDVGLVLGSQEEFTSCDNASSHIFNISRLDIGVDNDCGTQETWNIKMHSDNIGIWLTHSVLCFWNSLQFDVNEVPDTHPLIKSVDVQLELNKIALMISDESLWSFCGPMLNLVVKRSLVHIVFTQKNIKCTLQSSVQVNYKNIHKIAWEPFVEPWDFETDIIWKHDHSGLRNSNLITDIHLKSIEQLNVNLTESSIECVTRLVDMIKNSWLARDSGCHSNVNMLSNPRMGNLLDGHYSPYKLQNLTSLWLMYHLFEEQLSCGELKDLGTDGWISVQPGALTPVLLNATQEHIDTYSKLDLRNDRRANDASHHFMSVQLDGMSYPSMSFSIDFVGRTYFEVDFSQVSSKLEDNVTQERDVSDSSKSFVIPVVVDVSVEDYSKVIRLYSTVILFNATTMPLQLRFDIPFGVTPKVLDPLFPGEEFPVPLHLAEVGRMRCCPFGSPFLWSEIHDLSNIISLNSKGFFRPFVCYPSIPSSHPFRCCLSVEKISLLPPLSISNRAKSFARCPSWRSMDSAKERYIYQVKFSTPFIVNNYLPNAVSLTMKSGGVTQTVTLTEVEIPFYNVDPAHDLSLEFAIPGFKPSSINFTHAESFSEVTNFFGKRTLVDSIIFYREHSDIGSNALCLTVEKIIDSSSGSREISLFAPFLLFNCTSLHLNILETQSEGNGSYLTVPSCYDLNDSADIEVVKHGLHFLLSDPILVADARNVIVKDYVSENTGRKRNSPVHKSPSKYVNTWSLGKSHIPDLKHENVQPFMFSPSGSFAKDVMIQVRKCAPGRRGDSVPLWSWSAPFLAVAPSGFSTVLVPESSSSANSAYIMSVSCIALGGPLSGRTQAIIMQPRYVICNACSKNLLYKQKGSGTYTYLEVGQHSSFIWTEITRELLVSVCFDEPGWQWSGSFLLDHLGDTLVKMRNYDGSHKMIRVEVQHADTFVKDEKIDQNLGGNSGTNLVLISEDYIGFVPYRIDNLSSEKLRIYQQKCESFDTLVHPYTCCPYSWDEPYYPHRLVVEVPGERIVGSFDLDNQKEIMPVHLQRTSEKSERTLLVSAHAEGAIKVLRIIDSSFHCYDEEKVLESPLSRHDCKREKKSETYETYQIKFSAFIHSIGISIMSNSQELLFACANSLSFDMLQKLDQHKLSVQISSLQIDNQLPSTAYPVVLFFNLDDKTAVKNVADGFSELKIEEVLPSVYEHVPALSLAVATLKKNDFSVLSFEYIIFRVSNFHLDLDQKLLWELLDLFKSVSSRIQSHCLTQSNSNHNSNLNRKDSFHSLVNKEHQPEGNSVSMISKYYAPKKSLPSVIPIGAPWQALSQNIGRNAKIFVEFCYVSPIEFSLSFSSSPRSHRLGDSSLGSASYIHRSLMALADVEGAQIQLNHLTFSHKVSSLDSLQNLLTRHYSRQFLHEMYKVFGSAGVIGNPIGFARSLGHGIRDFMTVPTKTLFKSPSGLLMGMAEGTTSLVSNAVYAFSDATTQFTKAAHKGIVALTLNDTPSASDKSDQEDSSLHKDVVHEVLEGLTGLLQSPVKEVEKHGLPGIISGVALGLTGLLARPAASILEVTGKTAQSIKKKSMVYQKGHKPCRMRFPRPMRRDAPLSPYSWEEAIGLSILEGRRLTAEHLLLCKALKLPGKYAVITQKLMLIVRCSDLVNVGKAEFKGIPDDMKWTYESEIRLENVIHASASDGVVHVVGSSSDASVGLSQHRRRRIAPPHAAAGLPLFQTDLEFAGNSDADLLLRVLSAAVEDGRLRGWGASLIVRTVR